MKKTRYTEAQIMGVLRHMEGGVPAAELCREHGMSSATLYKWRAKCGGMKLVQLHVHNWKIESRSSVNWLKHSDSW